MKMKHLSVLLVLLIALVLAVSGCTTPTTTTPSANPTAIPEPTEPTGTTEPTSAPTATSTPSTSIGDTVSSLFKKSYSMLEYRMAIAETGGESMTSTYKIEMLGQEMHEGKMMNHVRFTTKMSLPASETEGIPAEMLGQLTQPKVIDSWADPNAASTSSGKDVFSSDAKLKSAGPDTVTIDGKVYACTKYTSDMDGTAYSFWVSPQAPAPVKYQFADTEGSTTMELISWS